MRIKASELPLPIKPISREQPLRSTTTVLDVHAKVMTIFNPDYAIRTRNPRLRPLTLDQSDPNSSLSPKPLRNLSETFLQHQKMRRLQQ